MDYETFKKEIERAAALDTPLCKLCGLPKSRLNRSYEGGHANAVIGICGQCGNKLRICYEQFLNRMLQENIEEIHELVKKI